MISVSLWVEKSLIIHIKYNFLILFLGTFPINTRLYFMVINAPRALS